LIGLQERLDPVSLLHEIRERQRRLVEIADKAGTDETQPASVEEFLAAQDSMARGDAATNRTTTATETTLVEITQRPI
jgi:hypothetical protein